MRHVFLFVGLLWVAAGCGSKSPAATGTGGGAGNGSAGGTGGAGTAGAGGNAGGAGAMGGGGTAGGAGTAGTAGTSGGGGATGGGGTAGTGGAGVAGATGAGGATGTAGTTGAAGSAGGAGTAGTAGTTGTAGTGGAAGAAGIGGRGGTTGAAGTTGSAGSGGSPASAYVIADVDGVTTVGDMNLVAYRQLGIPPAQIRVHGLSTAWQLVVDVNNAVGPSTACTLQLATRSPAVFQTFTSGLPGGSCSVAVTRAAPNVGDETEGTFSGVALVFIGGTTTTAPITVTNGRFRVPRIADQSQVGAN